MPTVICMNCGRPWMDGKYQACPRCGAASESPHSRPAAETTRSADSDARARVDFENGPSTEDVRTTLWAWGYNSRGQLGESITEMTKEPRLVPGVPHVRAVVAGTEFAHALDMDDVLWSWGANDFLQVHQNPGDVVPAVHSDGPVPYTQIAAGARTSYALMPNGRAVSWGSNEFNERGNGVSGYRNIPTREWISDVQHPRPFVKIAAGGARAAAVDIVGGLWVWGNHQSGALGLGPGHEELEVLVPRPVPGVPTMVDVVLGEHAGFAIDDSGSVWQWGHVGGTWPNERYESSPVVISGLGGIKMIAAGFDNAFALSHDGSVWMWGTRLLMDADSTGTYFTRTVDMPRPVRLEGLPPASAIATGSRTLTVLARDGSLWDWVITEYMDYFFDEFGSFNDGPSMLPDVFGGPVIALSAYKNTTYALAARA